ncbi:serine/threonine-protein kinase [Limnoglobus roseus]|uniref:Serine/threonine protein kinase n=1 Tax=Limnoglobus roseus TaxID=2598579 RepID=A0A5C1A565_9BACT|nr:serine/threonine-protein kinase [Limnoglobus roseus]QEL13820.1 serine/threonine protein kinase [Limnoglobus roseus]
MSSVNDDDARPDTDLSSGPTGTFHQHINALYSGTLQQPEKSPADGATQTFAAPDIGPQPSVSSRHELTLLIARSKEGLDAPLLHGYELLRELGSGAYGTVWEARNTDTHERVAIKFFLSTRQDTGTVLEEVTNLRDADGCYGIISVKQVNRHGTPPHNIPNYVMSLEMGGSLQKKIDAGRLPTVEAVALFTQLCRAMAFVHARGLLHCDLKPANILLNTANEPVVADFGQAQRASSTVAALGTFFFMAPEQATRQIRTPATQSDVYSLGAILYTMLVGKPPRHDEALLAKLRNTSDVDDTLDAYREGLKNLPTPTAHREFADPLLAQVIDRCLSLDPVNRPDDAGDILRGLKHRDWWARTKPIITVGTVATAVAILFMVSLSILAADYVLKRSKADITREIQGSLLRDAWFGRQETEGKLQERIDVLESAAENCPRELRATFASLAAKVAANNFQPAVLTEDDRRPVDEWLKGCHRDLLLRESPHGRKGISIVLATQGRGFIVSRVRTRDGQLEDRTDPSTRQLYSTDWSFRDYFNGKGNDYAHRGQPHEPIRATQISYAYQSSADKRPWLIDVSTPILANPAYGGQPPVVAVLVSGFDLSKDLKDWIEAPPETFPPEMTIASQVRSVLVNERGSWVWHEDRMAAMAADPTHPHDPERYLVETEDGFRFPTTEGPPDPLVRGVSSEHRDSLAPEDGSRPHHYIAAYEPLRPFAQSRYEELKPKEWYLIVKLDAATALRPVDELKQKMLWAGSILFAGLLALTVTLWVWLIRLLRRQEFATHG